MSCTTFDPRQAATRRYFLVQRCYSLYWGCQSTTEGSLNRKGPVLVWIRGWNIRYFREDNRSCHVARLPSPLHMWSRLQCRSLRRSMCRWMSFRLHWQKTHWNCRISGVESVAQCQVVCRDKKTTIWISPDSFAAKSKWSENNNRGDEHITAPVRICIIKRLRSSVLRVRTRWSRSLLHCSGNSCP